MGTLLTPIEKNMAAGMSPLIAFLTESTCGESCWHAVEDVCRCSCGGKNHGCLRSEDGIRPVRTAKIDGWRYELAAVGEYAAMYREAHDQLKNHTYTIGNSSYRYHYRETDRNSPWRVKCASKSQMAAWPELAAYRENRTDAAQSASCLAALDEAAPWPYLLWRKVD